MSIIEQILAAQRVLREAGAAPRELRVSSATYEALAKALNDRATQVAAEQGALRVDTFQGLRIVIDDRLADGEAQIP